ncbi:MAG: hypothetical protein JKX80_01870 [Candidatus Pacebacteria bacterium]|nr:hypothetical protein [Candidatus Paceibacterota bacterium]
MDFKVSTWIAPFLLLLFFSLSFPSVTNAKAVQFDIDTNDSNVYFYEIDFPDTCKNSACVATICIDGKCTDSSGRIHISSDSGDVEAITSTVEAFKGICSSTKTGVATNSSDSDLTIFGNPSVLLALSQTRSNKLPVTASLQCTNTKFSSSVPNVSKWNPSDGGGHNPGRQCTRGVTKWYLKPYIGAISQGVCCNEDKDSSNNFCSPTTPPAPAVSVVNGGSVAIEACTDLACRLKRLRASGNAAPSISPVPGTIRTGAFEDQTPSATATTEPPQTFSSKIRDFFKNPASTREKNEDILNFVAKNPVTNDFGGYLSLNANSNRDVLLEPSLQSDGTPLPEKTVVAKFLGDTLTISPQADVRRDLEDQNIPVSSVPRGQQAISRARSNVTSAQIRVKEARSGFFNAVRAGLATEFGIGSTPQIILDTEKDLATARENYTKVVAATRDSVTVPVVVTNTILKGDRLPGPNFQTSNSNGTDFVPLSGSPTVVRIPEKAPTRFLESAKPQTPRSPEFDFSSPLSPGFSTGISEVAVGIRESRVTEDTIDDKIVREEGRDRINSLSSFETAEIRYNRALEEKEDVYNQRNLWSPVRNLLVGPTQEENAVDTELATAKRILESEQRVAFAIGDPDDLGEENYVPPAGSGRFRGVGAGDPRISEDSSNPLRSSGAQTRFTTQKDFRDFDESNAGKNAGFTPGIVTEVSGAQTRPTGKDRKTLGETASSQFDELKLNNGSLKTIDNLGSAANTYRETQLSKNDACTGYINSVKCTAYNIGFPTGDSKVGRAYQRELDAKADLIRAQEQAAIEIAAGRRESALEAAAPAGVRIPKSDRSPGTDFSATESPQQAQRRSVNNANRESASEAAAPRSAPTTPATPVVIAAQPVVPVVSAPTPSKAEAEARNLSQFYAATGKKLPSLEERREIWKSYGLDGTTYNRSGSQNRLLLEKLQGRSEGISTALADATSGGPSTAEGISTFKIKYPSLSAKTMRTQTLGRFFASLDTGRNVPSVASRAKAYERLGLGSGYTGELEENTRFVAALKEKCRWDNKNRRLSCRN